MASTKELDSDGTPTPLESEQRPKPLGSLTASALRLTSKTVSRPGSRSKTAEGWQDDAWDMYDLVGEQHFLSNTLSGRLAQAKFYVGELPDDRTEDINPTENDKVSATFDSLAGVGPFFAQIIARLGLNLFMAGEGYLVGAPPDKGMDGEIAESDAALSPLGEAPSGVDLDTLEWSVHSASEIVFDQSGNVKVKQPGKDGAMVYPVDSVFLIRIWRSHPRYQWQADSPTRAVLPTLRELVGLTMHISAQIDSRLAGAGVFLVPESADRAVRAAAGQEEGEDAESPFTIALMDAMIEPINDRASASAIVPIMPSVPDDSIEKFRYISFATPLDGEARELRDEAIRRLALGQDCPPELLLGTAGMNHWGAWLVREDVVVTHLEPPLALICDALTTQFLWPILEQQGVPDFKKYVIWFDMSHMIMRPDLSSNAKDLHTAGVISDESLREATGFDESDIPEGTPNDPAAEFVLQMVRENPTVASNPGIEVLLAQVTALMNGTPVPPSPQPVSPFPPDNPDQPPPEDDNTDSGDDNQGPPASSGDTANPADDNVAASGFTAAKFLNILHRSDNDDD